MPSRSETVIAPPGRWLAIDWRELWRYRDLFLVLAWRDVAVRYKQTALGVAWAVFQPLVTMVIFTFVFNRMANITSGDATAYPVFLYVGLLFWQFYSGTLSNAGNSMISNAALVQKVYFPRLIVPASSAVTCLVDMAISAVILAAMMVHYGIVPSADGILVLPVLLLSAVLSALGLSLVMASLNIKYRDVRFALPFFIQILMFVTPVIYPVRMLDGHPVIKGLMLWLNPISGVITNARAGLLGQGPVDFGLLGISLLSSAIYFAVGMAYFRSTERYFADIV